MDEVVITGGGGALARAIAAAFSQAGYPVAAPLRAELDVTDAPAVERWFRARPVELLVCNAGITRDGLLARMDEAAWDEVLAVNLDGAARCAAAVLPGMAARGYGQVIFISSHSAIHPPAGQAAYATAKAALLGLTRALAAEAGPSGVRINAVLPGFLETPMTASVSAARREEVRRGHVLGRFNEVEPVAKFLLHLHRDLPHTSGQVFQLDSRAGV